MSAAVSSRSSRVWKVKCGAHVVFVCGGEHADKCFLHRDIGIALYGSLMHIFLYLAVSWAVTSSAAHRITSRDLPSTEKYVIFVSLIAQNVTFQLT